MELDELKYLWKKTDADFKPRNEEEIASMLKGSSRSIVFKIKRSVWMELLFTLVAGIALLIYALTIPSGALKWTTSSILVVLVAYTFYYVKKLRLLQQFNRGDDNMRVNLTRLIDSLTTYLRFYKRSYTVLYPVYFVLALLFGALEQGFREFLTTLARPKTIAYLFLLAGVFYFCSTWLVNWLLKKLYGNRLEQLKAVLRELENAEDKQ